MDNGIDRVRTAARADDDTVRLTAPYVDLLLYDASPGRPASKLIRGKHGERPRMSAGTWGCVLVLHGRPTCDP